MLLKTRARTKRIISIAGILLFVFSLIGLLYSLCTPSQVTYSQAHYSEEIQTGPITPAPADASPISFVLLCLIFLPLSLLLFAGLLIWGIKNRNSLSLRWVGSWFWSHAYAILSIAAGIYLVAALVLWLWFGDTGSGIQTVRSVETSAAGQVGYIAVAELQGPEKLRFGSSNEIVLETRITEGTAPTACWNLSPDATYIAIAYIQAVNFDIDRAADEFLSIQMLSLDQPATWNWVVSPKEKRLGKQSIAITVYLRDESGRLPECIPTLLLKIDVSDPLGLPPSIVYGAMALGGVLGVPFWTWMFTEWSTRQKEKREQQRRSKENS